MTTISISTDIKQKLEDERKENESINDILARLMDECDDIEPYVPLDNINIRMSEETFYRLKSLKGERESYNSVIVRLINSKKSSIE